MRVLGVDVPAATVEERRVLDVPAIDMTNQSPGGDAVAQPPVVSESQTRRRRGPANSRAASSKPATTARRKRRNSRGDGSSSTRASTARRSLATETVEAVDKLVSAGATKTDAFKQVAEQSGRTAGTVANSYYRAARQSNDSATGSKRQRNTRRSATRVNGATRQQRGSRRGTRRVGGASDIDRLAEDVISTLSQLTEVVAQQSRELAELRARVDGVRRRLQ